MPSRLQLSLECCRDATSSHGRPPCGIYRRAAKRSAATVPLSQATSPRCALMATTASVRRHRRRVFPRARSLRTITRNRMSLARKYVRARTWHGSACAALVLARAREGKFARVPTKIIQYRKILCEYNPHPFPAPCTLPRDDSCSNASIYQRCGTSQVYSDIYR